MNMGTLYLVATPIGNLEDVTLRALSTLRAAAVVACEDTRRTRVLLDRYGIKTRVVSYFGAKEKEKARQLLGYLREGKDVALVSDAGMPGISDPGVVVVREAIAVGVRVVSIPGPSAAVAALAASGLSTDRFVFEGFLPKKESGRKARLLELLSERRTMVFYESPRRLKKTLGEIRDAMGERRAVVVRELTKLHEEFIRGTVGEVIATIGAGEVRGEIVILVEGGAGEIDWSKVDIPAYVEKLEREMGIDRKAAIKLVAQLSGIAKGVIYKETVVSR